MFLLGLEKKTKEKNKRNKTQKANQNLWSDHQTLGMRFHLHWGWSDVIISMWGWEWRSTLNFDFRCWGSKNNLEEVSALFLKRKISKGVNVKKFQANLKWVIPFKNLRITPPASGRHQKAKPFASCSIPVRIPRPSHICATSALLPRVTQPGLCRTKPHWQSGLMVCVWASW